jgi:hypothetical protein
MAARFTVTFEDESLHKKAKIAAVERGVPLKTLIEDAIREFLDADHGRKPLDEVDFDWDVYDEWQAEIEKLGTELRGSTKTYVPGGRRSRSAPRGAAAEPGANPPAGKRRSA